ncbi:MAG: PhnB protein [Arcticibacterium sp.]|jgi:PhnB protein
MITEATKDFEEMKTSHYLFTEDVDALQSRALKYGAKEMFPPTDMDYGDRQGGVIDPAGNYWWISKRLKNVGHDES